MAIRPVEKDFFSPFRGDACTLCGQCFHQCPVMLLPINESVSEMKRLIAGEPTKRVLKECQSCFSCNFYCPEMANPASLILTRWNQQYRHQGLKKRGWHYMTLYPHYPNFRSYVIEHLPEATKTLVRKWASLKPLHGDTIVYPGCNIITFAELTRTSIFNEFDIRGRLEYCCGETLFRTGYREELFQVARRLDKWFNILKPEKLLVLCTAGTNVFKNVLPHYGLTYHFKEIKSYIQFIWEKFERGEVPVKKKLDMTVSIQDSCYAKMFGDGYMDLPRRILNEIGIKVVEIDARRENMRCCGIGAGFSVDSAYQPFKIRSSVARNFHDLMKPGVDAVCVYCAGCLATYTATENLTLRRPKIFHIIELIQMAMDEKPLMTEKEKKRRGDLFFWGTMRHQLPLIASGKTFRLAEIPEDPPEYGEAW